MDEPAVVKTVIKVRAVRGVEEDGMVPSRRSGRSPLENMRFGLARPAPRHGRGGNPLRAIVPPHERTTSR